MRDIKYKWIQIITNIKKLKIRMICLSNVNQKLIDQSIKIIRSNKGKNRN